MTIEIRSNFLLHFYSYIKCNFCALISTVNQYHRQYDITVEWDKSYVLCQHYILPLFQTVSWCINAFKSNRFSQMWTKQTGINRIRIAFVAQLLLTRSKSVSVKLMGLLPQLKSPIIGFDVAARVPDVISHPQRATCSPSVTFSISWMSQKKTSKSKQYSKKDGFFQLFHHSVTFRLSENKARFNLQTESLRIRLSFSYKTQKLESLCSSSVFHGFL